MGKSTREKYQFRDEKRQLLAHAINKELPAMFDRQDSPIHLNHCFARVVYDTIVQGDWRGHVKAPAIANFTDAQIIDGLEIVRAIKNEGAYYLAILDQQSLKYRGKSPKKKTPEQYKEKE